MFCILKEEVSQRRPVIWLYSCTRSVWLFLPCILVWQDEGSLAMFKMGSLLAFGTVYLLMHICAWAQETSEESSVRFTVEFSVEVITSLIVQLDVVSLFSFLIFFSHSSCRKQQFILNLSFGIWDFTDLGLLKIRAVHWFVAVVFPLRQVFFTQLCVTWASTSRSCALITNWSKSVSRVKLKTPKTVSRKYI